MSLRCFGVMLISVAVMLGACTPKNTQQSVEVTQVEKGVQIRSSDTILFDTGKAEIKPSADTFLNEVAKILNTEDSCKVEIEGHTDNVGTPELNQELSELRALMVMKALVDRGVDKSRMKASGFGMTSPIADNTTDEGRKKNRRVDILLLGQKKEEVTKTSDFDRFMDDLSHLFD